MRSHLKISAIVILSVVASLSWTDQSAARSFEAAFSIHTSDGYRIAISGWRESVRVLVVQDPVNAGTRVVETEYTTRGVVSRKGIEADLGSLGSISMQFRPLTNGNNIESPKNCSPRRVYRRPGIFSGSFYFRGENSYTTFETDEVRGSIGDPQDLLCMAPSSSIRGLPPVRTYLDAGTSNSVMGNDLLIFSAIGTGNHFDRVDFTAECREQIEDLNVRRFVTRIAPATDFIVGPELDKAVMYPPAPFSGTATFVRASNGARPRWSGSLSISFLGKSNVPLTGPSFRFVALGRSRF